jgi:hypothetical protein
MSWRNVVFAAKLGSVTLVATTGAGYMALYLIERFIMHVV